MVFQSFRITRQVVHGLFALAIIGSNLVMYTNCAPGFEVVEQSSLNSSQDDDPFDDYELPPGGTTTTSTLPVTTTSLASTTTTTVPPGVFSCTGNRAADSFVCTGDQTGLTANTGWAMVNGSANCTARKCEYYCGTGASRNPQTFSCVCANGANNPMAGCNICPSGQQIINGLCQVPPSTTTSTTVPPTTTTTTTIPALQPLPSPFAQTGAAQTSFTSLGAGSALVPQPGQVKYSNFKPSKIGNGFATWDGRLMFGNQTTGEMLNGEHMRRWVVSALRPQALSVGADGKPDFSNPNYTSNWVCLDSDTETDANCTVQNGSTNQTKLRLRMHMYGYPNPAFPQNPYPSTENGTPVADQKSRYWTYKIIFIGASSFNSEMPNGYGAGPGGSQSGMSMFKGTVVLRDKDTAQASIERAAADPTPAKMLRLTSPILAGPKDAQGNYTMVNYFRGYEPSFSLDGRLLLFSGHPVSGRPMIAMYSFNPNPDRYDGWSPPASMTRMYYNQGPGRAGGELLVAGVRFSERYPIAASPLKDIEGVAFGSAADPIILPGSYPWISWDATEVFTSSVRTFTGNGRAAATVIGKLTNWGVRHIDSMSPTRGNPSAGTILSTNPERSTYVDSYEKSSYVVNGVTKTGLAFGSQAWERILMNPIGFFPSAWEAMSNMKQRPYPLSDSDYTYSFILSHSGRYVETSLFQVPDGNYIIYWPMNEAITHDRSLLRKVALNTDTNEEHSASRRYNIEKTPDVSGRFITGSLQSGAQFPYEYHDVRGVWESQRINKDIKDGIVGSAVYMQKNSSVRASLSSGVIQEIRNSGELTVSFWVKHLSTGAINYIQLGNNLRIHFAGTNLRVSMNTSAGEVSEMTPFTQKLNEWQHIAVSFKGQRLQIFINGGEAVFTKNISYNIFPALTGNRDFIAGPDGANSGIAYVMDEVSLSKVARTREEVDQLAFVKNIWSYPELSASVANAVGSLAQARIYVPPNNPFDGKAAALGQLLFNDKLLSADRSVSCASCHQPNKFFQDNLSVSPGINAALGARNTPTTTDTLFHRKFFWDGRVTSLEVQARQPLENPVEMGLPVAQAVQRLKESPVYQRYFRDVYGVEANEANLYRALAAYQRTLIGGKLLEEIRDLSASEARGKGLFFGAARCANCHSGPLFTDSLFHNLGFLNSNDTGEMSVSGRSSDRNKFRTPGLRNVQHTAPYFHDGRFQSLNEVIDFYDRGGDTPEGRAFHMQPLGLTPQQKTDLINYLKGL